MGNDMFAADERRRNRLLLAGWLAVEPRGRGSWFWTRPDGAIVTEQEAFLELDRLESQEGEDGGA